MVPRAIGLMAVRPAEGNRRPTRRRPHTTTRSTTTVDDDEVERARGCGVYFFATTARVDVAEAEAEVEAVSARIANWSFRVRW